MAFLDDDDKKQIKTELTVSGLCLGAFSIALLLGAALEKLGTGNETSGKDQPVTIRAECRNEPIPSLKQ